MDKRIIHSMVGKAIVLGGLAAASNMGCGTADVGEVDETVVGALTVADKIITDGSGDMTIMVRTCDYPATAAASWCQYCAVDPGWVMIGGGAQIEGQPQARLRGSHPYPNSVTKIVSSNDNLDTNCTGNVPTGVTRPVFSAWMGRSEGEPHKLRVYVIGLKVAGMSEEDLTAARSMTDAPASDLLQPAQEASLGVFPIVGGGADEVGTKNCFLTESRPNATNNSWQGAATCSAPGSLKVYAIAFPQCLAVPGWDYCANIRIGQANGGFTTGFGTASMTTSYPWITLSAGGRGRVAASSSRYLADLYPVVGSSQGVSVTSKDQGAAVNGITSAYSITAYGGRWGTWLYNSVRFNSAGTTLHRPSGAAPVALMQAAASPDSGPYRWSLEPLGAGQYRVRNANPASPATGECAYRQTNTTNVLVGACSNTNEHKWTIVDDLQGGQFKLRNVSSASCLDNNNSTTGTALRLASCVTGFSTRQSLFLDHYSWP
jgi:hypothetical protein